MESKLTCNQYTFCSCKSGLMLVSGMEKLKGPLVDLEYKTHSYKGDISSAALYYMKSTKLGIWWNIITYKSSIQLQGDCLRLDSVSRSPRSHTTRVIMALVMKA